MTGRQLRWLVVAALFVLPSPATAQSTPASIAGVARDSSGAVLPGVTVEAASPALIEKVRSAVTDGQGQYKITELRPGSYAVTFTLPGFKTVRREGVELPSGFTATINAEMSVGGIEETITVSGASPVVDTQNSRTQQVFEEKVLDALPVSRTENAFGSMTLGISTGRQDVGGGKGENTNALSIHGSPSGDSQATLDGMHFKGNSGTANIGTHWYKVNQFSVQETTISTGAATAETESGGVYINYVPKDGGNRLSLLGAASFANGDMQGSNLDQVLIGRGVLFAPSIKEISDYGIGVGGPLRADKLWFYSAHRKWGSSEFVPSTWWNLHLGQPRYAPDLARPGYTDINQRDHSGRVTWSVTQRQKITIFESYQDNCFCWYNLSSNVSVEAAQILNYRPINMLQGSWSYVRNRLIIDGGVTNMYNTKLAPFNDGVTKDSISITDSGLGITYNAPNQGLTASSASDKGMRGDQVNGRAAVAYVTGSHAFKGGYQFYLGLDYRDALMSGNGVSYNFRLGAPTSLTQWATPQFMRNRVLMSGFYAQDQWTLQRLTLNLGVRLDRFRGWSKAIDVPAGPFLPARSYEGVSDTPNWSDVGPRLGATYDLFGNGRTAIKMFLGRYVQSQGIGGLTEQFSPANLVVASTTRQWNDAFYPVGDARRGNFVPDCVLTNFALNGECGAIDNNLFGSIRASRRYDPDWVEGFGVRPYTWQGQVAVQQELYPGVALTAGYYRTSYGNFSITENAAISPADYDSYCVTVPVDARLPGGGGNRLCGLYDLKPSAFGRTDTFVTLAENFGEQSQVFNGVDVSITARLKGGAFATGGVSTGKTKIDKCYNVDSPGAVDAVTANLVEQDQFCDTNPPLMANTQFKGTVVYPLPWWGIQTSMVLQNLPGATNEATRTFTNAEIAPSLGRNLSGCPSSTGACSATRTIRLYQAQTQYENRLTQVDLRLSKNFKVGNARIQGNLDVANMFNGNAVLATTPTFGPNWLRPSTLLSPRLFKVGGQIDF